jgi:hypothetical protein
VLDGLVVIFPSTFFVPSNRFLETGLLFGEDFDCGGDTASSFVGSVEVPSTVFSLVESTLAVAGAMMVLRRSYQSLLRLL